MSKSTHSIKLFPLLNSLDFKMISSLTSNNWSLINSFNFNFLDSKQLGKIFKNDLGNLFSEFKCPLCDLFLFFYLLVYESSFYDKNINTLFANIFPVWI